MLFELYSDVQSLLQLGASDKGSWSRKQLAFLGVPTPPKKGWKHRIVGREIPNEDIRRFLELKNAHSSNQPKTTDQRREQFISDIVEVCKKHSVLVELDDQCDFDDLTFVEHGKDECFTVESFKLEEAIRLGVWDSIHLPATQEATE